MYIRRTTIKSRRSGEPYYTYRLVESTRTPEGVRRRTVLNLGRRFEVPREQWEPLARRIEQLASGQRDLIAVELDAQWEAFAQRNAARVIRAKARSEQGQSSVQTDYQAIDVNQVEPVRPRSVALEHVALEALRQVGLDTKLEQLGFNGAQRAAAIGTVTSFRGMRIVRHSSAQWLV